MSVIGAGEGRPERESAASDGAAVDFDLHGLVAVRLLGASRADAATVAAQLGPIQGTFAGEPDIVIRFVDRIQCGSRMRYLGLDEAAFTDDVFLLLRRRGGRTRRVQLPLDKVGGRCEIVCERGIAGVPLLAPILNLTALAKGALPLHASAFRHEGTGVVTTGWAKGGKTETLLAFMARGAEFVGDEWVHVSADGRRVLGLPQSIRLWAWHLEHAPSYRRLLGPRQRFRLGALGLLQGLLRLGPAAAGRLASVLQRLRYVDVLPDRLFGTRLGPLSGPFDQLYFVMSDDAPGVRVEPADAGEIARRMAFSLRYERAYFMEYYDRFRFAFPGSESPIVETAAEREAQLLRKLLAEKPAWTVRHPYPAPIPALYDAISPLCRARAS